MALVAVMVEPVPRLVPRTHDRGLSHRTIIWLTRALSYWYGGMRARRLSLRPRRVRASLAAR